MTSPILKTTVTGYNDVKDIDYSNIYSSLTASYNKVYNNITNSDGDISIEIDYLGTISAIIVEASDAILKIIDGSGTQTLKVKGILVYEVIESYASTITAMSIATGSSTALDVEVTIYGNTV